MDLNSVESVANRLGRPLNEDQKALLEQFRVELYQRNEVTNLTRISQEDCDARHFAESLLISEFIEEELLVLDIGPGPGFPGWVLAVGRPDLQITCIESQGKMNGMLLAIPLPNLQVLEQRAEMDVQREKFEFVTGRAVAPFAVQAEISAPWLAVGGLYVPFRTPGEREEIETFNAGQLGLVLEDMVERELEGTDLTRLFPVYRKVRATPREFPRQWGRIKGRPIGSVGN